MTRKSRDYDRLTQWLYDYFPDNSYTTDDVIDYLANNVDGWTHFKRSTRKNMIRDWENHVGATTSFGERVLGFLGRLFR